MSRPIQRRLGVLVALSLAAAGLAAFQWNTKAGKHLRVVEPGRLIRGAWQSPDALRAIIAREHIKTIVTLTAINRDDPKYVGQAKVVSETGVRWLFVPMRIDGDGRADGPGGRPAGRSANVSRSFSIALRAIIARVWPTRPILIRHCGWSAAAAWKEVASLPWARPAATADQNDRALIDEFARFQTSIGARRAGRSRPRFMMTTLSRSRSILRWAPCWRP